MFSVYKVTNTVNGKMYVGFTCRSLEQRWRSHLSAARQGSPYRLHAAIRKHGPDPWRIEKVMETPRADEAREAEEQTIASLGLLDTKRGYNAKPGGCGGAIVPPEKHDEWRRKISASTRGDRNPNALPVTNEEIVALGVRFAQAYGRLPSHEALARFGTENGVRIPLSMANAHRGGYASLRRTMERETGIPHQPYFRSPEHRRRISETNRGRRWFHSDGLRHSALFREPPSRAWMLGRKSYDQD